MHWWPRTIRWQMLLSLVLIEVLSIALFAFFLVRGEEEDSETRTVQRVKDQAAQLAVQSAQGIIQERPDWVGLALKVLADSPTVAGAKITDSTGKVLFNSSGNAAEQALTSEELEQIEQSQGNAAHAFRFGGNRCEGMHPIYVDNRLRGYAWVESDYTHETETVRGVLRGTLIFGGIWIVVSTLLAWFVSRFISRPLTLLHSGTRALMTLPEGTGQFPLPVAAKNEFGDLIDAFNRMVASIVEQRAGLNDTLSLLDSMLTYAPIGLAFVDRNLRIVRVNQPFASLTRFPLSRHLGRTVAAIMPPESAARLEDAIEQVFAEEIPACEIELSGEGPGINRQWTWLVSVYPVITGPGQVRWAGVIVRDVSERVRAEETLRKTEKLAATGRLAASIAHEINNPLEALTNILYLLRNFTTLDETAHEYVTMAEHEVRRVAEIAQQTLRFYRQSTMPTRATMAELIDSVLDLYKSRINNQGVTVERDFDPQLSLFCYSGEIRQVFANLLGNAVDAALPGSRIIVRARASHDWKCDLQRGVRFTVADTGSGMDAEVRERIFEAFFTTKEATGTGLGLWVSHEIIQKHSGVIRVRSRAAHNGGPSGTVFQIFLPDDEGLAAPLQLAGKEKQGVGNRE